MEKLKNKVIIYLLTTDPQKCDLFGLAPLNTETRALLIKMRKGFIKKGELAAAQKLSHYLQAGLGLKELRRIIKSCWQKNKTQNALEAINLLLQLSPLTGKKIIIDSLEKCIYRAKHGDYYYRPAYQKAVNTLLEMNTH